MRVLNSRERQVEEAIDRAVRELMDAEPSPGLRRHVVQRLHEESPARVTFPRPLAAAAIAAAALAVMLTRPAPRPQPRDAVTRAVRPAPSAFERPTPPPPKTVPHPTPSASAGRRRSVRAPVVIASVDAPAGMFDIAPLPTIASISIPPVGPAALPAAREIVIAPIDLQPLEIGPLPPPR